MPKLSKTLAEGRNEGPGTAWSANLEGYVCDIVETTADADLTPLLVGLPNDQCHSPHWGFVKKGTMWWNYGDHEEVTEAGEAFYIPPGHTSGATADSEFVVFSPAEEMALTQANMARRAQELYGAAQLKG